MPDWCQNKLTVEGTADQLNRFMTAAEGPVSIVWADDPVSMKWANDPVIAEQIRTARDKQSLLSLPRLVPSEATSLPWDGQIDSIASLPEIYQRLDDLFAGRVEPRDGYEWQLKNWGTKWGVEVSADQRSVGDCFVLYEFISAWSPIEAAVHHFAPKWPDLSFRLQFLSEDCRSYGETEYVAGKLVNDYFERVEPEDGLRMYRLAREVPLLCAAINERSS